MHDTTGLDLGTAHSAMSRTYRDAVKYYHPTNNCKGCGQKLPKSQRVKPRTSITVRVDTDIILRKKRADRFNDMMEANQ